MVEHFYVKFGDPSWIGFWDIMWKNRQNVKNPTHVTKRETIRTAVSQPVAVKSWAGCVVEPCQTQERHSAERSCCTSDDYHPTATEPVRRSLSSDQARRVVTPSGGWTVTTVGHVTGFLVPAGSAEHCTVTHVHTHTYIQVWVCITHPETSPLPQLPTHLFLHPSLLPLLIHHSAHPLLHLSFTPGLKPTSFTNPTPLVVSLLPPGLPPRTFACTVSSKLLGF